jgi:SAM-dependent methyltransferase
MIARPATIEDPCPVCQSPDMNPFVAIPRSLTVARCARCGLARGEHAPQSNAGGAEDHFRGLNEDRYLKSVRATRLRSYDRLLAEVRKLAPRGTWLDVGSGYGWLLERVAQEGYSPLGIEPSAAAADQARAQGLKVVPGYFPGDLPREWRPQIISFMDVLEHLSSPIEALRAAASRLTPGGIVVVQVPDQACLLFRLAAALCRVTHGKSSFAFERLWLVGFDFPHLYYFTLRALQRAMNAAGLKVLRHYRTPIGYPREALDRVAYTHQGPPSLGARCVALALGGIHALDNSSGYGGLLTMIGTPATDEIAAQGDVR